MYQNIAARITEFAQSSPEKIAIFYPKYSRRTQSYQYETINFKELEVKINQFCHQLTKLGLKKGDKTLLFLRPSLDFHAMVFALFKTGIIPVLIDPGMGRKNLLKCIHEVGPVGLIAEKEIHLIKIFFPKIFKNIKFQVSNRNSLFFKLLKNFTTIKAMKKEKLISFSTTEVNEHDLAAILFTSGGTGIPKGVEYTHFIFNKQTDILKEMFKLTSEDRDMAGFPLFSLFTLAMGMSTIIPDMDPSKPSLANPKKLYQHIIDLKPSFVAGSPSIWENLAHFGNLNKIEFKSIRVLAMFGAPVSLALHKKFQKLLPFGTTYTPYGATESLPVSNISGEYILKTTAKLTEEGKGTCIGFPAPQMKIKLIKITDDVIKQFDQNYYPYTDTYVPGEIIVQGPVVTKSYYNRDDKTLEAKINDENTFWHRMGDIGYFDNEGKLWFLGRKAHIVFSSKGMEFPIPVEAIFNKHQEIKRSALVGIGIKGEEKPCLVIERKDGRYLAGREKNLFESELMQIAKKYPHTEHINQFYYSESFPVDIRHNIKIDRTLLKKEIEANEQL